MLDFKSTGKLHVEGEAQGDLGMAFIWVFPEMMVPPKHPKMIIFRRNSPWLLGTTILGTPHIVSLLLLMAFRGTKYLFFAQGVCYWFLFFIICGGLVGFKDVFLFEKSYVSRI